MPCRSLIYLMMIRKIFVPLLLLCFSFSKAATVDTISIFSPAMQLSKKCVVIVPDKKKTDQKFPVVYLLHGYSGRYDNWISRVPALKTYADDYQLIIVCPDGDYNSWYVDSPIDRKSRFETYVSTEVPEYIDRHFPTRAERNFRAITGLSMGGHGAMYLAWRHADKFSACGSMSGVMDLRPFAGRYELQQKLGDTASHPEVFYNHSVINLVKEKPADSLAIIFDCGTKDVFYPYNKALHVQLLQQGVSHDYAERPGSHNWDYWANAVVYQLLFFKRHFDRMEKVNN